MPTDNGYVEKCSWSGYFEIQTKGACKESKCGFPCWESQHLGTGDRDIRGLRSSLGTEQVGNKFGVCGTPLTNKTMETENTECKCFDPNSLIKIAMKAVFFHILPRKKPAV